MEEKMPRVTRIGIFIDGQNLYHAQKELGIHIDYGKFINQIKKWFAEKNPRDVWVEFVRYYGLDVSSVYARSPAYKFFISRLKKSGINIIGKDFKIIRNENSNHSYTYRKLNFDVEIAVDAMDLINRYDVFVLVSGDSDFDYLAARLKSYQKSVCAISTQNIMSQELKSRSHIAIWLEKIADKIKLK